MKNYKEVVFLRKIILVLGLFLLNLCFVSAFEFNGTAYDVNGAYLNNTNVSMLVRDDSWNIIWFNSTQSNASGWFNMTVDENNAWFYQPSLKHFNGTFIDYMGQTLPAFPLMDMQMLGSISFYLEEAGTINITAVNNTGGIIKFNYQVKDQLLGFPIEESFSATVAEATVYGEAIGRTLQDFSPELNFDA